LLLLFVSLFWQSLYIRSSRFVPVCFTLRRHCRVITKNLNVGDCEGIRDFLCALARKDKPIDNGTLRSLAERIDPLATVPDDSRLRGRMHLSGIPPMQYDRFGSWQRGRLRPLKNDLSHFLRLGPDETTDHQVSVLFECAEVSDDFPGQAGRRHITTKHLRRIR
jgi:hypothetical protein